MGALLVYFAVGALLSVPPLGYYVLRTRRELNELRAELQRRGLVDPVAGGPPVAPDTVTHQRLGDGAAVSPRAPGSDAPTAAAPDQRARSGGTDQRRG